MNLLANTEVPILNACVIPHRLRHGAVHGALGTLAVSESMILLAPHNPLPLLAEIEARPESFEMEYLVEGEPDWQLKFTRTA